MNRTIVVGWTKDSDGEWWAGHFFRYKTENEHDRYEFFGSRITFPKAQRQPQNEAEAVHRAEVAAEYEGYDWGGYIPKFRNVQYRCDAPREYTLVCPECRSGGEFEVTQHEIVFYDNETGQITPKKPEAKSNWSPLTLMICTECEWHGTLIEACTHDRKEES